MCLFVFVFLKTDLFVFGFDGSSSLCADFSCDWGLGDEWAPLPCNAQASYCSGFPCCRAWAVGTRASVAAAPGAQRLWLMGYRALAQYLWCLELGSCMACGSFPDHRSDK